MRFALPSVATRILVLALGLAPAGCNRPTRAPAPRLVVLYIACTVNKSFLAPHDPRVRFTPQLEAFARQGVVFRRHVAECGQSGIDFATIFTGKQAFGHGIYDHPNILAERNELIAESFAAAGYDTYYWSGHAMASARIGYGQGVPEANLLHRDQRFEDHGEPFPKDYLAKLSADDPEFARLLARLAAEPDYRAFVQIAFTATHEPYQRYASAGEVAEFLERHPEVAPGLTRAELERWLALYDEHRQELNWDLASLRAELPLDEADVAALARVLEATYSACVAQLDSLFGRLVASIDAAGLGPESLVAFTSDHGELLYRDNASFPWTHGPELVPEVLDVPWFLRAPGLAPGAYAGVTRSIDVFPTLAGLAGVPVPTAVQGLDLAPALRGEAPAPSALAFSHSPLWPAVRIRRFAAFEPLHELLPRRDPECLSVRVRDEDLVCQIRRTRAQTDSLEAFDAVRDPEQRANLFDPANPRHARLAELLRQYKQTLIEGFDPENESGLSESEVMQRLRSLGYAGKEEEREE